MAPRLTIAIPTLNRVDLLRRAIESALSQRSTAVEIIVSDNGSADNTPQVIQHYEGRGLRTFRHESTMSAVRHSEFLLAQASGEFFVGLSDDDYLEPNFADEVLARFDENPQLAFVYTACAVHYEDRQVPSLTGPPVEAGFKFLNEYYAGRREISWCACVTRVRHLREIGPIPEGRIMGDMFFWTKLALRGDVGCVPRVLSHYVLLRERMDNVSHQTAPALWARDSLLTATELFESLERAGVDSRYVVALRARFREHVARSAANQFVWNRLRGATLIQALRWIPASIPYLGASLMPWGRMLAALTLPRSVLRSLLLKAAEKLARTRHSTSFVSTAQSEKLIPL